LKASSKLIKENLPDEPFGDLKISFVARLAFFRRKLLFALPGFSSHFSSAFRCSAFRKTVDSSAALDVVGREFVAIVASVKLFAFASASLAIAGFVVFAVAAE
jgi:hypothetical protein